MMLLVIFSSGCVDEEGKESKERGKELELTIGDMEFKDRVGKNYPSQPEKGKKFFVVFVTVKNTGKESEYIYSGDFTLENTNKNNYDASIETYGIENYLGGTDIKGGGSISGSLVFEIPENSIPSLLYCSPLWSDEVTATINSGLIKENYNKPPVADAGNDQTAFIDDEATLDGSKSNDPEGGDLDFEWDYGDDTTYTGSGETATHTYDKLGTFTVTLTVTDDCGLSDTDTVDIAVKHYFELTVNDHGWHETLDPFDYHAGDYEVSITMKNVCPDTKTVYSTFFELITSDGTGYGWNGDDDNAPESLGSGSSASWTIYFDVPEDKTPVKIVYDDTLEKSL